MGGCLEAEYTGDSDGKLSNGQGSNWEGEGVQYIGKGGMRKKNIKIV